MGGKSKSTQTTNQVGTINQTQTGTATNTSTAAQIGDQLVQQGYDAFNDSQTNRQPYSGDYVVQNGNWTGPTTAVRGAATIGPNATGQQIAQGNANEFQGLGGQAAWGAAQTPVLQGAAQQGQQFFSNILGGAMLNPASNPYYSAVRNNTITGANIANAFSLNAAKDAAAQAGAWGGTGTNQGLAMMLGEQSRNIGDTLANMDLSNYQTERAAMERAPGTIAELSALGNLGNTMQTQAGTGLRALEDLQYADNRARTEAAHGNEQFFLNDQFVRDNQNLVNQQGTFGANIRNQQDAITNSLLQSEGETQQALMPFLSMMQLLSGTPTTTTANSTNNITGTTTQNGTTSTTSSTQASPLQIGAGLLGAGASLFNPAAGLSSFFGKALGAGAALDPLKGVSAGLNSLSGLLGPVANYKPPGI